MTFNSDIYFENYKIAKITGYFCSATESEICFPKDHLLFLFNTGWEEQSITKKFFFPFFFQKHLTHVLDVN